MAIYDQGDPRAECPRCGRTGMVGSEREIVGLNAVTIFKCHACNHTWRVPDQPSSTPAPPKRTT